MDKSKKKVMQALPSILHSILPAGIVYDDSVGRFRNESGQFVSSAEAQKNVITRKAATEISDGLQRLLFQFNRMLAYTTNAGNIKAAEYEAIKDASREAAVEAVDAVPEPVENINGESLLSSLSSAFTTAKSTLSSIIQTALKAAFWGTGALVLLSGILKKKDKENQREEQQVEQLQIAVDTTKQDKTKKAGTRQTANQPAASTQPSDSDIPTDQSQYEPVTTGGYGKATITNQQLVGAPGLSSLDTIFSGGRETTPNTRGGARQSDSVRIRPIHPVTKKKNVPHAGTDISATFGTRINAVGPGRVIRAGAGSGYGNIVDILHGTLNGQSVVTRYAHLSAITTTLNAMVGKGQKIGEMGSTGLSTASHLHFELIIGGTYVKPTQQQVDYVISHAVGETQAEAAPNWSQTPESADPKVSHNDLGPLGPIIMGTPETKVAAINMDQFRPPIDDAGNSILKSNIRSEINAVQTAATGSASRPSIPARTIENTGDPKTRYYIILGPVAGLAA